MNTVTSVVFQEQVEIPLDVLSLNDFRSWSRSDDFPEKGRIDFVDGRIEVDMAPEDLFCHGTLKSEIAGILQHRVKHGRLGHLFIDSTRVSCPDVDFSVEPDIVFLAYDALKTGRVRLIPKSGGAPGQYVEIEGAPDLIVEIVSDTSVAKDTRRLPKAYFQAGVREFWLVDARLESPRLTIHHPGPEGYQSAPTDAEGFQRSLVLACGFRLKCSLGPFDDLVFDLQEQA